MSGLYTLHLSRWRSPTSPVLPVPVLNVWPEGIRGQEQFILRRCLTRWTALLG